MLGLQPSVGVRLLGLWPRVEAQFREWTSLLNKALTLPINCSISCDCIHKETTKITSHPEFSQSNGSASVTTGYRYKSKQRVKIDRIVSLALQLWLQISATIPVKKRARFCKSVASIKDAKIVVSRRIPGPKKPPRNGALKLVGKRVEEKVGKGKKTLGQCRGNIKISKGGGKKLSLQNLVQKV